MYLEDVTVRAGHEVLIEVEDDSELNVGDPRGILVQQLNQVILATH
jgi:hypothetical protein